MFFIFIGLVVYAICGYGDEKVFEQQVCRLQHQSHIFYDIPYTVFINYKDIPYIYTKYNSRIDVTYYDNCDQLSVDLRVNQLLPKTSNYTACYDLKFVAKHRISICQNNYDHRMCEKILYTNAYNVFAIMRNYRVSNHTCFWNYTHAINLRSNHVYRFIDISLFTKGNRYHSEYVAATIVYYYEAFALFLVNISIFWFGFILGIVVYIDNYIYDTYKVILMFIIIYVACRLVLL